MTHVPHPDAPEGKADKYARPELERRFLLAKLPPGEPTRRFRIEDRYLTGTRLRLRRMTEVDDAGHDLAPATCKLAQKVPSADGSPGLITNIYLSPAEFDALAVVPARSLQKVRSSYAPYGVDVFEGALAGLVLVEVEFDTPTEMAAFWPALDVVAEVTGDVRFTGGRFIEMTRIDVRELLAEFGIEVD